MGKYLSQNPLRYSVLFIAFAGEEAGLLGSKYFTQNPLVPLKKMRFLVNLDLLGTGEEGIMVVNATEFTAEFLLLESLNQKQPQPLAKIGQRGKAANSDHYWFSEAGVPSFFIYTLGGINAYHDVYDRRETLPLTCTATVANMLVAFFAALSGTPSR
jgi:Zn-dependent M28 family amino/carboxypeptidase